MKLFRRILVSVLGLVVVGVAAFAVYVASHQDLTFSAPAPHVAATTDSATVARGRYLVEDLVGCAECHADSRVKNPARGELVALAGGGSFVIPPGKFYVPNITPDVATGIGGIPDSLIARAWRYGVRHDGRALLPFMEFQGLSDEDIVAVLSYVRAQPAVAHAVPAHEPNLLGRIVLATFLSRPIGPKGTPPVTSPRGATVENGRYLVEDVARCASCHTQRSHATGEFTGPHLAGAKGEFDDGKKHPTTMWSPANLTTAPRTGVIARLSEDQFVARFRAGEILPGSPMPWSHFQRMHEDDLRAIYRYLKTVPPVENDPGPRSYVVP